MSTIRFRYEGVSYEVEVVRDGDVLTITHQGTAYRVELEPATAPAATRAPALSPAAPAPPPAPAPVPAASSPTPAPAPAAAGPGVLPAPMTGTVKEIKVAAGDQVSAGQLVVVMEAMKMDIDVTAPAAGTVAEVHVDPGDNRAAGQPLLTIR